MKTIYLFIGFIFLTSFTFAQEKNVITDIERFITQPGSILETNLLHKNGKQYQNPYRKIDFSLAEYANMTNDSVIKGIKLMCITDYITNQTRIYYSFIDIAELDRLLNWIETAKKTPLLKKDQAIYFIPEKGKLMLGVIKSDGKKYFQYFNNKYDYSTSVHFDMDVLHSFQEFLNKVDEKIEKN